MDTTTLPLSPSSALTGTGIKVIVIGAGLAGSLLANGLMRAGVEVIVYERLAADSVREGYQITLGAPALAGFRACLGSEHLTSLMSKFGRSGSAAGERTRAPVVYDAATFRPLIDLTRLPNYSRSAAIYRRVLRDSLAKPITTARKLHYDRAFGHYEIIDGKRTSSNGGTQAVMDTDVTAPRYQQQPQVRVHFEDGSSDDCDILIAADGVHSRINKLVGLNNIKQLTTHVSLMVKAELSSEALSKLPQAVLHKQAMVFAHSITIYFSVYIPDSTSNTEKQGYDPQGDMTIPSCMLAAALPSDVCPSNIAEWSNEEKLDLLAKCIQGWAKEWHSMIDLVRGSDVYTYRARVSSRPPDDWRERVGKDGPVECGHPRVWLLGDAMHAMLPNRGMGGNQSMLDAAKMLPLLVDLDRKARASGAKPGDEGFVEACQAYETEMIPRAFGWVQKSGGENIVVINLVAAWYSFVGLFRTRRPVDDTPEFK